MFEPQLSTTICASPIGIVRRRVLGSEPTVDQPENSWTRTKRSFRSTPPRNRYPLSGHPLTTPDTVKFLANQLRNPSRAGVFFSEPAREVGRRGPQRAFRERKSKRGGQWVGTSRKATGGGGWFGRRCRGDVGGGADKVGRHGPQRAFRERKLKRGDQRVGARRKATGVRGVNRSFHKLDR